jgi:hypothetical protein
MRRMRRRSRRRSDLGCAKLEPVKKKKLRSVLVLRSDQYQTLDQLVKFQCCRISAGSLLSVLLENKVLKCDTGQLRLKKR